MEGKEKRELTSSSSTHNPSLPLLFGVDVLVQGCRLAVCSARDRFWSAWRCSECNCNLVECVSIIPPPHFLPPHLFLTPYQYSYCSASQRAFSSVEHCCPHVLLVVFRPLLAAHSWALTLTQPPSADETDVSFLFGVPLPFFECVCHNF